ncbi:MAG: hypothetical protein H7239_02800 [Flavobacterium sp.]|nr:hypothetical protein [Flavobacterium sp.]
MEEHHNNQDEHYDDNTKNNAEEGINETLDENQLKIKWRKEISENQSMQQFLAGYTDRSVENFINSYIDKKYQAYLWKDYYSRRVEERRDKWINLAHQHLEIILHKKLFDLQCLWRAEQITLEGVEICYDFQCWRGGIINCPFIEPLTKQDIELYQSFLYQSDDYFGFESYNAQDYDELKEEYTSTDDNQDCMMPEWYEFHNSRTGSGSLLLLPNIRGEKEEFYMNLLRKKNAEEQKNAAVATPPQPIDQRPSISSYDEKDFMFFVDTFEDRETQIKIRNYNEDDKNRKNQDTEYDRLVNRMIEENEYIPIEAHYDFREALKKAYTKFENNKIAAHLPLAHEQYLFNKKMGFLVDVKKRLDGVRKLYYDGILEGRALNGEPRNLDF